MVATASSLRNVREDGSIGCLLVAAASSAAPRLQTLGEVSAAVVSRLRPRKPRREIGGWAVEGECIMRSVLVFVRMFGCG
jgi:hypothetical protein